VIQQARNGQKGQFTMENDTLLKPYESLTDYNLCEIGHGDTSDPFRSHTALYPTVEECVQEVQQRDPDCDLSAFHVIRNTYYNEGPLTDALRSRLRWKLRLPPRPQRSGQ
jgi:hypothetical protein